jgi:hypothetical protein
VNHPGVTKHEVRPRRRTRPVRRNSRLRKLRTARTVVRNVYRARRIRRDLILTLKLPWAGVPLAGLHVLLWYRQYRKKRSHRPAK